MVLVFQPNLLAAGSNGRRTDCRPSIASCHGPWLRSRLGGSTVFDPEDQTRREHAPKSRAWLMTAATPPAASKSRPPPIQGQRL
jgi:hypothetical protein